MRLWLLLAVTACQGQVPPQRSALFIGNSYLYSRDIPSMVADLANADGRPLAVTTVAEANLALIDHWNRGNARSEISRGGWTWVVLQQGPSSVEVNRDTLRLATRLFAGEISRVKARVALFSAWPAEENAADFARAIESYTLAARDVDGILLPVAAAWLAAWARDSTLRLYDDGLHPSVAGAYLAALVIYTRLTDRPVMGLPGPGSLNAATVSLLQQAATETALSSPRAPFRPPAPLRARRLPATASPRPEHR